MVNGTFGERHICWAVSLGESEVDGLCRSYVMESRLEVIELANMLTRGSVGNNSNQGRAATRNVLEFCVLFFVHFARLHALSVQQKAYVPFALLKAFTAGVCGHAKSLPYVCLENSFLEYRQLHLMLRVMWRLPFPELGLFAPFSPVRVKVGTLDSLMQLSDDLVRIDMLVENMVRKIEKQYAEVAGDSAEPLKVRVGHKALRRPRRGLDESSLRAGCARVCVAARCLSLG